MTDVTFSPTAVGTFNGTLTFTSTLANSPHQVSLVGTAFNPVSLAAATLPAATVGQAYSFDFKPLLNVSNEASPDRSLATWNVLSGTLPAGLSVNSATGILSGTPSSANAGASFTVQGSYKNNLGQQGYTIVVNGFTLQVTQISAGSGHTCAVTLAGSAVCWGLNSNGQLGDGTTTGRLRPTLVSGLSSGVASISAGGGHTCAVRTTGALVCWGWNQDGQLGNGGTARRLTPGAVSGLSAGVASVSAGNHNTCALTTAGAVSCWGAFGAGTMSSVYFPTQMISSGVASVSAGHGHFCVVTTAGAALCWGPGNAAHGAVGDGTMTARATPTPVSGLSSGVASISASKHGHSCAVMTSGAALCWGRNVEGQLGDGTTGTRLTPTPVSGLSSGVASLVTGWEHTCAVTTSGQALCWGRNNEGQMGDGSITGSTPVTTPCSRGGTGSPNNRSDGRVFPYLRDEHLRRSPVLGKKRRGSAGGRNHHCSLRAHARGSALRRTRLTRPKKRVTAVYAVTLKSCLGRFSLNDIRGLRPRVSVSTCEREHAAPKKPGWRR